jgi:transposase
MARWAAAPEQRNQMVLFSQRLDDSLTTNHTVRYLDEILGRLDWSLWEAEYHPTFGQPAIHPRVLAGVLIYGLLTRIRSSRALEEALQVRIDFRWLAEGRGIDHTTLSEFRRNFSKPLKNLFVQVCQLARELGFLLLQRLGYDGTRVRADNRPTGTRTPAQLQQERDELAAKFEAEISKAEAEDARDEEAFGLNSPHALPTELQDAPERIAKIDAVLQALQDSSSTATRIPVTDLDARIMPNKEGGFSPNYTPTTLVDIASGMIVGADVLNVVNEHKQMLPLLDEAAANFPGMSPEALLADGLMATGPNIVACEERGLAFYSPTPLANAAENPAMRADLTQAVPEAEQGKLPERTVKVNGETRTQFDKSAFVYHAENDCYYCPNGKPLDKKSTRTEDRGSSTRTRTLYQANKEDCAGCPLKERCVTGTVQAKQVYREQHESELARHAEHMAKPESKVAYEQRRHPVERPFAVLKQIFGIRRFLLRGLEQVKTEWCWATTAFNFSRLLATFRGRDGPKTETE